MEYPFNGNLTGPDGPSNSTRLCNNRGERYHENGIRSDASLAYSSNGTGIRLEPEGTCNRKVPVALLTGEIDNFHNINVSPTSTNQPREGTSNEQDVTIILEFQSEAEESSLDRSSSSQFCIPVELRYDDEENNRNETTSSLSESIPVIWNRADGGTGSVVVQENKTRSIQKPALAVTGFFLLSAAIALFLAFLMYFQCLNCFRGAEAIAVLHLISVSIAVIVSTMVFVSIAEMCCFSSPPSSTLEIDGERLADEENALEREGELEPNETITTSWSSWTRQLRIELLVFLLGWILELAGSNSTVERRIDEERVANEENIPELVECFDDSTTNRSRRAQYLSITCLIGGVIWVWFLLLLGLQCGVGLNATNSALLFRNQPPFVEQALAGNNSSQYAPKNCTFSKEMVEKGMDAFKGNEEYYNFLKQWWNNGENVPIFYDLRMQESGIRVLDHTMYLGLETCPTEGDLVYAFVHIYNEHSGYFTFLRANKYLFQRMTDIEHVYDYGGLPALQSKMEVAIETKDASLANIQTAFGPEHMGDIIRTHYDLNSSGGPCVQDVRPAYCNALDFYAWQITNPDQFIEYFGDSAAPN